MRHGVVIRTLELLHSAKLFQRTLHPFLPGDIDSGGTAIVRPWLSLADMQSLQGCDVADVSRFACESPRQDSTLLQVGDRAGQLLRAGR